MTMKLEKNVNHSKNQHIIPQKIIKNFYTKGVDNLLVFIKEKNKWLNKNSGDSLFIRKRLWTTYEEKRQCTIENDFFINIDSSVKLEKTNQFITLEKTNQLITDYFILQRLRYYAALEVTEEYIEFPDLVLESLHKKI